MAGKEEGILRNELNENVQHPHEGNLTLLSQKTRLQQIKSSYNLPMVMKSVKGSWIKGI